MPYCFQVRFRTSRPVDAFRLEAEIQSGSFEQPLRFCRPSGMANDEGWLAIEGRGYANFGEARDRSKRFQDALLISAATRQVGVEFGSGAVFPGGRVEIVDPGAPLPAPLKAQELREIMNTAVESASVLSENQRVAAELLNSSFFEVSPEARFLLRVSAVEALCPQGPQSKDFRDLVAKVKASIPEASGQDRRQLEEALDRVAARRSARSAYMSKIQELLGKDKAARFDDLYGRRSNFLHDGQGRGTFGEAAQAALEIGLELLLADMHSAQDQSG